MENPKSKQRPSALLTILCLYFSKDLLLQILALLPQKFRGPLDPAVLTQASDPLLGLLSVVPVLILIGWTEFGSKPIYQQTINYQKTALILSVATGTASQISVVLRHPYTDQSVAVALIGLSLAGLVMLTVNYKKLYCGEIEND